LWWSESIADHSSSKVTERFLRFFIGHAICRASKKDLPPEITKLIYKKLVDLPGGHNFNFPKVSSSLLSCLILMDLIGWRNVKSLWIYEKGSAIVCRHMKQQRNKIKRRPPSGGIYN
jgi:hypothetical protein